MARMAVRLTAPTTMATAMVASSEPRRIMSATTANTRTTNSSGGSPVAPAIVDPMPTLAATMIRRVRANRAPLSSTEPAWPRSSCTILPT